ncbi:MAG TPA: hypothetical protein VMW41_02770 [Candidatus Bathyarchaeia archaeon]|nr:hypothetical protein [Candidatus Bathyarchaeia archaeon]
MLGKNKENRINFALAFFSCLCLILIFTILYLYSSFKKVSIQKPYPSLNLSAKHNNADEQDLSDQTFYRNEQFNFSISYPKEWGEVSSENIADRTTFNLGPDSGFSVTTGKHYYPGTSNLISAKELAEDNPQEGCLIFEAETSQKYLGYYVSCLRSKNSTEQFYYQQGEIIYIIYYRYDATQIEPEKAKNTFNQILNSFLLL